MSEEKCIIEDCDNIIKKNESLIYCPIHNKCKHGNYLIGISCNKCIEEQRGNICTCSPSLRNPEVLEISRKCRIHWNNTENNKFTDTCSHGILLANSCEKCFRDMSVEAVDRVDKSRNNITYKVSVEFLSNDSYASLEIENGTIIIQDAYYVCIKEIK